MILFATVQTLDRHFGKLSLDSAGKGDMTLSG